MDRQLPPAAACGISLGGGGTRTAVPGRFGNQPCLTCRPACRRFPGVSMDTMSLIPRGISEEPRRRTRLGQFRGFAHVPMTCESSSTSCRITCRRRSTIRGGITCSRMDRSASSPSTSISESGRINLFVFMYVLWRAPRRRPSRRAELTIRDRARAAAGSALREHLAAGSALLGQAREHT